MRSLAFVLFVGASFASEVPVRYVLAVGEFSGDRVYTAGTLVGDTPCSEGYPGKFIEGKTGYPKVLKMVEGATAFADGSISGVKSKSVLRTIGVPKPLCRIKLEGKADSDAIECTQGRFEVECFEYEGKVYDEGGESSYLETVGLLLMMVSALGLGHWLGGCAEKLEVKRD
jgi:hypothetical protein